MLIPLVQSGEQLIVIRLLIGLAGGFGISAPFPIAAELMPAQHRRTYGAIYQIMLASSFTLLPLTGVMLADNQNVTRKASGIGAFVPVIFGKETVGQLETVTEGVL